MADLLYEKNEEEHYAVFTMNRPQALNAMGSSMNEELNVALHDFNNDREMLGWNCDGEWARFLRRSRSPGNEWKKYSNC